MNTDTDFVKGSSDNLPPVSFTMIQDFYLDNLDYLIAESRNAKNLRAARLCYGDNAIGYVQLRRESDICTVKGRVTPEHRVHNKMYSVTVVIDEIQEKIIRSKCEDCAASSGGCKHAIAFIYWLHRRHEEASVTSTVCYWNKPKLSKVGSTLKWIKAVDMGQSPSIPDVSNEKVESFVTEVLSVARKEDCSGQIFDYFKAPSESIKYLSIHHLIMNYKRSTMRELNVTDFFDFCRKSMDSNICETARIDTCSQSKSQLWYELRYARITASKIYEAASSSTYDGSLVESLFGAYSIPETAAISRGKILEDAVLRVVEKKVGKKFEKTGLVLDSKYPILGASPDAICEDFVVEVKCPSKKETIKNYIKPNGRLTPKCYGQIFLQMLMCGKEKGLFCVASPNFEIDGNVQIIEVELNLPFLNVLISNATDFWEKAVFPILIK